MSVRRRLAIIAVTVAGIVVLLFSNTLFAWCFPRTNFARVTGYSLPRSVRVVQFKSRFCDNLLKKCYYWELEGPVGVIFPGPPGAKVLTDFDYREGYRKDALEVMDPAMRPDDVPECYKWERNGERSQFMFRHKDGKRIYYMVSTL